MKINILTLFPEMFDIFNHSIIGKAQGKGIIDIEAVNIRDYTNNKHKKVRIIIILTLYIFSKMPLKDLICCIRQRQLV